jgi:hypothetical protein
LLLSNNFTLLFSSGVGFLILFFFFILLLDLVFIGFEIFWFFFFAFPWILWIGVHMLARRLFSVDVEFVFFLAALAS